MKALTEQQVRSYRHDGFLFPIPALTPQEAAQCMADLERAEARLGVSLGAGEKRWRSAAYTYLPWVDALVRNPHILDVVEDVIGPDILVYMSTFFIKEPAAPTFTAWHQDSTYFGLDPHEHVTAWVAFSDASAQAGCMDVVSARGAPRQMHHRAAYMEHSLNGAGQVIVEPVDDNEAVAMELKAGEMSLHNTLCPHRSAPNRAQHRRIGLGISYVPATVLTTGPYRMNALLVRGRDYGNFDLLSSPAAEFDPEGVAANERFIRRWRENYTEQEKRHEEEFARRASAGEIRCA